MSTRHAQFAELLCNETLKSGRFERQSNSKVTIEIIKPNGGSAVLNLTPFAAPLSNVTAAGFFSGINSVKELKKAYLRARQAYKFETDIDGLATHVSDYAQRFVQRIFSNAEKSINNNQASLVGQWVANLDVYTAVKAVESLLNSKADLTLLEIARQKAWAVHFDHLAIRCGTQSRKDAERVATLLQQEHGYVASQVEKESYYHFPEGWNAYPLYKVLENGQVLRLFIDQSDGDQPQQIIQHWNRVYGFTAHHLAIRATKPQNGYKVAVTLDELISVLEQHSVPCMTPTGHYTEGLLLQVFTRPEKDLQIPPSLKQEITQFGSDLNQSIENAKLLELVSRREMSNDLAERFFELYNIKYEPNNELHSAPVYQYFLPAQAAHVIKTSLQTGDLSASTLSK